MVEEGLHFGDGICPSNTMDLIEHFGRYAALAKFVKGQRVLDIACGKGYGSWLLKEWGASSVLGLDTSEEAIVAARREFSRDGVDFRVANAGDAVSALPTASFDLIACFDTIEHVMSPSVSWRVCAPWLRLTHGFSSVVRMIMLRTNQTMQLPFAQVHF